MSNVTRSRWVPPAVWAAFIAALTSWPNPRGLGAVPAGSDKLAHALLYAVLGYLVVRALEHSPARSTMLAVAILGCAVWGALDEWHQVLIPGRSADVEDWIADASGGAVGAVVRTLKQRHVNTGTA